MKTLKEQGTRILCLWEGRVREQPERSKLEGLCPVVSRKATRLKRSRKGLVCNFPPRKPITVTGMQWTGAFITGMEGMIHVVEHKRRWCNPAENTRRSAVEQMCEAMGGSAASHL